MLHILYEMTNCLLLTHMCSLTRIWPYFDSHTYTGQCIKWFGMGKLRVVEHQFPPRIAFTLAWFGIGTSQQTLIQIWTHAGFTCKTTNPLGGLWEWRLYCDVGHCGRALNRYCTYCKQIQNRSSIWNGHSADGDSNQRPFNYWPKALKS